MTEHAVVERFMRAAAPTVPVDRGVFGALLAERPRPANTFHLLSHSKLESVRAAVLYIAVHGSMAEAPVLALCLRHRDAGVAEIAEYGLWRVWMEAGSPAGNETLAVGIRLREAGDHPLALRLLGDLAHDEPTFAEAHFQHGLVLAELERHTAARDAFTVAARRNQHHFAAFAARGHACIELDDFAEALRCYRRALAIHPRLHDLTAAVRDLAALVEPWRRFD